MPSTRRKRAGYLDEQALLLLPSLRCYMLYEKADSKCLLLMQVSYRRMGGAGGKSHAGISGSIESTFLIYSAS